MAKEGIKGHENILKHYVDICDIVDGDVSAEVISTDFERMGKTAADFVLDRTVREQVIPTSLIIRESL